MAVSSRLFIKLYKRPAHLWVDGSVIEPNYLSKKFHSIIIKSTLSHIRLRRFRHPYATTLYKAGVDVKTAQEFLGHSSINVTLDIYTHLEQKTRKKGMTQLNDYISKFA